MITFLGLTRSDDSLITPSGATPEGVPIYTRLVGVAFSIVVEAMPGTSGLDVGGSAYQSDGTAFPEFDFPAYLASLDDTLGLLGG